MEKHRPLPDIHTFFDAAFYCAQFAEPLPFEGSPLEHYLRVGWRHGHDPSPRFSTTQYLEAYPDVAADGINPLLHYVSRGWADDRIAPPCKLDVEELFDPDYYRNQFTEPPPFGDGGLEHFLTTGWREGYDPSVIFSTDAYLKTYPDVAAAGINPLLHYAQHGFAEGRQLISRGRLKSFYCSSVLVSAIISAGTDAKVLAGRLELLLEQSHSEIEVVVVGPAALAGGHRILQTVLDDSGMPGQIVVCDKQPAAETCAWIKGAQAAGGELVWIGWDQTGAERRHRPEFLQELVKLFGDPSVMAALWVDASAAGRTYKTVQPAARWFAAETIDSLPIDYATSLLFRRQPINTANVDGVNNAFSRLQFLNAVAGGGQIAVFTGAKTRQSKPQGVGAAYNVAPGPVRYIAPRRPHILMASRGFHVGGAEIFPIHLSNALLNHGYLVSMLSTQPDDEKPSLRDELDPRIAVYDPAFVLKAGFDRFPSYLGIDLIHSHCASVDHFFFGFEGRSPAAPYVISLHGHYDCVEIPDPMLKRMLHSVSHWVYTAEKNLRLLNGLPPDAAVSRHISNGMPPDSRPFAKSREALGIAGNDLVFTLVARPILAKGWAEAISAINLAQTRVERRLVLLLCGEGPVALELRRKYQNNPNIVFLGEQDRINGLYAISDCALLPTRFAGESYPLCLIQAMQAGTPILATTMGHIGRMINDRERSAGLLVDANLDTPQFVEKFADLMVQMADDDYRRERAADAALIGAALDIKHCAASYANLYEQVLTAPLKFDSAL